MVNINLLHNELPAKIDIETGEVKIASVPSNTIFAVAIRESFYP